VRREAPQADEAYGILSARHRLILERANRHGAVNIEAIEKAVTPTIDSVLRNPNAMAWTIFSRKRSGHHINRAIATSVWAIMFGRHLGFDRQALQDLAVGGLLLDIGNVSLSEDILNLEGAITIEQYEHLSRHVHLGLEVLQASKGVRTNVLDMVRCHHERADGSGYPDGMTGNDIPIYGRIAGIVDCYDAMTTKTLYSPAMAAYDAARELNEMSGEQFQAEVVEQFLRTIGMFPTGSVVELNDGAVGVVLEQNQVHPLRPKLMLLLNKNHDAFGDPQILDMEKLPEEESGTGAIWIAKGHEHGAFGIDPMDHFNQGLVPGR
jgi:HD-GYP domain-containing protein (c-di-GMP phosphodiesterase class II)